MHVDIARRGGLASSAILLIVVSALVLGGITLAAAHAGDDPAGLAGAAAAARGGMMGGIGTTGGTAGANVPQPGDTGFVAGTIASPRIIHVIAGPGYAFRPSAITVARGETVTFAVTAMGGSVHEFMVGPADAVAADAPGTPEAADIGMMQTRSVTYTFDGNGPYAFACHATGHYEAGMRGTITLVG
jgi:uncharacterized cupredoxin-like copper-binding protein